MKQTCSRWSGRTHPWFSGGLMRTIHLKWCLVGRRKGEMWDQRTLSGREFLGVSSSNKGLRSHINSLLMDLRATTRPGIWSGVPMRNNTTGSVAHWAGLTKLSENHWDLAMRGNGGMRRKEALRSWMRIKGINIVEDGQEYWGHLLMEYHRGKVGKYWGSIRSRANNQKLMPWFSPRQDNCSPTLCLTLGSARHWADYIPSHILKHTHRTGIVVLMGKVWLTY